MAGITDVLTDIRTTGQGVPMGAPQPPQSPMMGGQPPQPPMGAPQPPMPEPGMGEMAMQGQEPPAEEPVETTPVPAAEITKPPTQRELRIKQARTKYKDSPFKQWAHANQALAKALKPGQVGYKEVQEYFKEQENLSSAGKVGWQGRQGMR